MPTCFGARSPTSLWRATVGRRRCTCSSGWTRRRRGAPVFAQPVPVKCPFTDRGTVFQTKDGVVHGLWIVEDELVHTFSIGRRWSSARRTDHAGQGAEVTAPGGSAPECRWKLRPRLRGLRRRDKGPEGTAWTEEWRPFNSSGIAVGEPRYHYLNGARLPSLLKGPLSDVQQITLTKKEQYVLFIRSSVKGSRAGRRPAERESIWRDGTGMALGAPGRRRRRRVSGIGSGMEDHFLYFPTRELAATPANLRPAVRGPDGRGRRRRRASGLVDPRPRGARAAVLPRQRRQRRRPPGPGQDSLRERLGLDVFLVDYRGYGQSQGSPSEEGLYRDARAIHGAADRARFSPEDIVLFGESLGSAVAIQLALDRPSGAVVLETPFLSLAAMAREHYPFVPTFLLRSRYDNAAKIPGVLPPKLFLVAERDEIVPPGHGPPPLRAGEGAERST